MKRMVSYFSSLVLLLGAAGHAQAGLIVGQVWENTSAAGNATIAAAAGLPSSTPTATFNAVAINYGLTLPDNTLPYASINNFLGFGENVGNTPYTTTAHGFNGNDTVTSGNLTTGTYFLFTGTVFLSTGTHSLSVTHDDGASLAITGLGVTAGGTISAPGPTTSENSTGSVTVNASGNYQFQLAYGEVNGDPAILNFTVDGNIVGAPEPSTLISASMAGLVGMGALWNRRRRAKVVA